MFAIKYIDFFSIAHKVDIIGQSWIQNCRKKLLCDLYEFNCDPQILYIVLLKKCQYDAKHAYANELILFCIDRLFDKHHIPSSYIVAIQLFFSRCNIIFKSWKPCTFLFLVCYVFFFYDDCMYLLFMSSYGY